MFTRHSFDDVTRALAEFPVVGLIGPRQVGKTTLAIQIQAARDGEVRYLDLESPADRTRISDPEAYFARQEGRLVVLDEIHRAPELFALLRGVVDERRRRGHRVGQFLVLGSASLELLRQSSESLAGRIVFIEMTPILAAELAGTSTTIDQLWLRGGFPDSLLARSDAASLRWRRAFVRTYLERDIPQFGPRIPAETLGRLWTMLAHLQGQQLNAARLAGALGVSGQTITRYLDLLVDLLLVRRLPPWTGTSSKRLVRAPKIFVRDSGIAHALLGVTTLDDLLGHPVVGASWEGMVIESLIAAAREAKPSYYRTAAGAEIDLILEGPTGKRVAIEIKRSTAPVPARGLWQGLEDINAQHAIVVYPGSETFPLANGVDAMGLTQAIDWVRAQLSQR